MKKLLLLSLTILLFSCGDNTERIIEEEDCRSCWEHIEVVGEIEVDGNPIRPDKYISTVTAENLCTGEQKTGIREVIGYYDPFSYVGNVMCDGLFEKWYTFE